MGYSGWMGILNDWFTTKGFANYSVANGKLADGDEIRVMYSCVGAGKDLGQSWENADIACKVGETATLTVAATAAEGADLTLTNESWTSSIGCGATKGIAAVDAFAIQRYVHYGAWS